MKDIILYIDLIGIGLNFCTALIQLGNRNLGSGIVFSICGLLWVLAFIQDLYKWGN